jgi:hypothetical protein
MAATGDTPEIVERVTGGHRQPRQRTPLVGQS